MMLGTLKGKEKVESLVHLTPMRSFCSILEWDTTSQEVLIKASTHLPSYML